MINILYEDNQILVVEKPINVPVQADDSKDDDLLSMLKRYLKDKYSKPGNVYLALVHRLDRPVGGVMVFAKNSKAAGRLSDDIRLHKMNKIYHAVVTGEVDETGTFKDNLLKDTKTNMVTVADRGKESLLSYERVWYRDGYSLVKIKLITGRSHQIRVQFSSRGFYLYGDQRYSKISKVGEQIALFASGLSFYHPVTKEEMDFSLDLPHEYPWNINK